MGFRTGWIRWIRLTTIAILLALAAPLVTGCGAIAAAVPLVTAIVADALAILSGIDTLVQEHFRRHPDVPMTTRQRYAQLYDWTLRSLRALQHSAEGAKNLDDGEVRAAFADFEAAYNELKGWLLTNQLMNGQSQLLLDGQVLSEEPVPEARALLR
jgi:hypothetical protein